MGRGEDNIKVLYNAVLYCVLVSFAPGIHVLLSLDKYSVVQEYFCNFEYYLLSAFLTEIQKVGRRGRRAFLCAETINLGRLAQTARMLEWHTS